MLIITYIVTAYQVDGAKDVVHHLAYRHRLSGGLSLRPVRTAQCVTDQKKRVNTVHGVRKKRYLRAPHG